MVLNFHNHILTNLTHWVAKISWLGLTLWACVERWRCHHEVRLQCNSQSLLKACLPLVFLWLPLTLSYQLIWLHVDNTYIAMPGHAQIPAVLWLTDWLTDWHGLTWHERVDGWWMMWWDWFDGAWIMIMEPNHGPGSWMNVMNGWWTDLKWWPCAAVQPHPEFPWSPAPLAWCSLTWDIQRRPARALWWCWRVSFDV